MEVPDRKICYRALQSRDFRFDGLIFVGVESTGIYCRPICPARTPKFEHCVFFGSAAAAQDAGFRPCLRCRPETAPDLASWRGTSNTVSRDLFHRPPSALRRKTAVKNEEEKDIVLRLRYRPPYDWESMLAFLRARAIPSLEVVDAGRYLRTVEIDGALGSIEVTHVADRH